MPWNSQHEQDDNQRERRHLNTSFSESYLRYQADTRMRRDFISYFPVFSLVISQSVLQTLSISLSIPVFISSTLTVLLSAASSIMNTDILRPTDLDRQRNQKWSVGLYINAH